MTVAEALDKISKALGVLTYQTRAENLGGLFSKNRLTEDLLLPVFRLVLKAPNLRNLNQQGANFPYIDLADDKSRLAIQVTAERNATKITDTLTGFISGRYQKRYSRLVFFILSATKQSYALKTQQKWRNICGGKLRFDPASDIITTLDLFPLIQTLPHSQIHDVHDIIAQSVIGEAYVDVDGYLTRLTRRQLDYEKKSGKYIPDIFVETRETKDLARSFAHPVLFFRRTLESLARLNIPSWNRFLAKAGLPHLPFPDLPACGATQTLPDTAAAAADLSHRFVELTGVLVNYEKASHKTPPPFPIKKDREHFYEENTFTLQSGLGWGLNYQLKDFLDELAAVQVRVFILTGRAGQGKTNFLCDFVETFLSKHSVPCAYITGRLLRSLQAPDLGDAIQRLLFEGKTSSFEEAARLLSKHADRVNKPFVLIIDGLNEHHRISEFSEQLQLFLERAVEYPHLKFLLTCRSEFFQQRFGNLTAGPLKPHIFLLEANEQRLEEECYEEMLAGYFRFFGVQRDMVSRQALESLKKDFLLLRFFCEAYGARNKPQGYQQPFIANIYREEIFTIYLQRKLGTANLFLQHLTGKVKATNQPEDLLLVLKHCVQHMLEVWQFVNVPVSVIPANFNEALYALLDEELILRRDAPPGLSVFSQSQETVNFTFDEFRDCLLAQYLLHLYQTDCGAFQEHVARNDPKDSQIIEGLKKFLFYASRHEETADFWVFYRDQPWYKDVYDREVFNIDTKRLRTEDRDLILAGLSAGGDRARLFARQLAVNWHPQYDRILNLDLLLSFLAQADDVQFDSLMLAFKTHRHFHDGGSASAFCKFITEHVMPEFEPDRNGAENGLFRFLIFPAASRQ